jgi:hypothetical protein
MMTAISNLIFSERSPLPPFAQTNLFIFFCSHAGPIYSSACKPPSGREPHGRVPHGRVVSLAGRAGRRRQSVRGSPTGRTGRRLRGAYWGLLGPTGAYWSLLMPTVVSVSIWLPVSSVFSACYCLDRHCVLKSLVTPEYDRE